MIFRMSNTACLEMKRKKEKYEITDNEQQDLEYCSRNTVNKAGLKNSEKLQKFLHQREHFELFCELWYL